MRHATVISPGFNLNSDWQELLHCDQRCWESAGREAFKGGGAPKR